MLPDRIPADRNAENVKLREMAWERGGGGDGGGGGESKKHL